MTLDTRIGLINPNLDAETVFKFCASLLGVDDDYMYGRSSTFGGAIAAKPGQGYPAWLIVDDSEPGYIEASFDTAYGYKGDNGEGCHDLHAWLIREIARWVPDNTTMFWFAESEGRWYKVEFGEDLEECLFNDFEISTLGDPSKVKADE